MNSTIIERFSVVSLPLHDRFAFIKLFYNEKTFSSVVYDTALN